MGKKNQGKTINDTKGKPKDREDSDTASAARRVKGHGQRGRREGQTR